jgi:hypothetical protein
MAAAVPFMMIAGGAMSAVSAIQQGKAAKAAAQFNATVNDQNAQIAREQAVQETRQFDREQYMRIGAIKAAQGKSGGAQAGSVLDILADTATQGEIQRQDIAYQGELRARGFQNTATLDRFEGKQAEKQGYLRAGSELLSSAGDAYTAKQRLKRT